MSRIGKLPISIPAGVTVAVNDEKITDIKKAYTKDEIGAGEFIVRRGKKNFCKILV